MRIYLLWLFVAFLSIYAFKDWHKVLCGLIVLMAFIERPDMPRSVFGIPGFNPWNILFATVVIGWVISRKDSIKAYFPHKTGLLLVLYALVVIFASIRQIMDMGPVIEYLRLRGHYQGSIVGLVNDLFINTFKYAVVGILFFYGSDSEDRVKFGLIAIFVLNVLIALQVIKWMPIQDIANGDVLEARARRVLNREVGYYRTDIAAMLSGAAWAVYSYRQVVIDKSKLLMVYFSTFACAIGMALTGGRTGMAGWVVVGIVLSLVKWKHIMVVLATASLVAIALIPSVSERMTQGFSSKEDLNFDSRSEYLDDRFQAVEGETDLFTVTAGRVVIWPLIIEKISDAPLVGYGRNAMVRTGLATHVLENYGEVFPHTHNAYLEMLLDNGFILSLPVFIFFFIVLRSSLKLLRQDQSPLVSAVGGVALSVVVAQLVASMGAQSFYPTSGTVTMWAAIGILLRVYADFHNPQEKEITTENEVSSRTKPNYYA